MRIPLPWDRQLESESKQVSTVRETLEQAILDAQLQAKKDIALAKKETTVALAEKQRVEALLVDMQKEVEVRAWDAGGGGWAARGDLGIVWND